MPGGSKANGAVNSIPFGGIQGFSTAGGHRC